MMSKELSKQNSNCMCTYHNQLGCDSLGKHSRKRRGMAPNRQRDLDKCSVLQLAYTNDRTFRINEPTADESYWKNRQGNSVIEKSVSRNY